VLLLLEKCHTIAPTNDSTNIDVGVTVACGLSERDYK
jgi:hypothetical protein